MSTRIRRNTMDTYEKWLNLKQTIKKLTEELHEVESDIYIDARDANQLNPEGSKTFRDHGYKVTIKHNESYKIDQIEAGRCPHLFRVEYKFNKKDYDLLSVQEKAFIDEVLTIVPGKPSFTVEKE